MAAGIHSSHSYLLRAWCKQAQQGLVRMWESIAVFTVAIVVSGVLIGVLAYLYAKSHYTTGKSETESEILKASQKRKEEAEEAHEKALREGREKYL